MEIELQVSAILNFFSGVAPLFEIYARNKWCEKQSITVVIKLKEFKHFFPKRVFCNCISGIGECLLALIEIFSRKILYFLLCWCSCRLSNQIAWQMKRYIFFKKHFLLLHCLNTITQKSFQKLPLAKHWNCSLMFCVHHQCQPLSTFKMDGLALAIESENWWLGN